MRTVGSSSPLPVQIEPNAQALRSALLHIETMQKLMPIKTTGRALGAMRFHSHEEMNRYDDEALTRAMLRNLQAKT